MGDAFPASQVQIGSAENTSQVVTIPGDAAAAPSQMELWTLEEIVGYPLLTRTERKFAEAIMQGKSRTEAARAAGVIGSEDAIRAAASRMSARRKVAAVLAQAWSRTGADIEETLRQAAEIARRAIEAWRDSGDPKTRALYLREWTQAATLIASIHGKLGMDVRLSGSVDVNHAVLTPELQARLIAARRRVMAQAQQQPEAVLHGGARN